MCAAARIEAATAILPFNCGDADFNEFLMKDAREYARNLLAVTNLFERNSHRGSHFDRISPQSILESKDCSFAAVANFRFNLRHGLNQRPA
jgi:hypothetical protein